MDILIINSLIVLNSLKSVMITTNYFGATLTERLPYTITELLCGCCCSDCRLLASRVLYGLRILSCSWLLRRRRYCCVSLLYCHYQGYCLSNYPKCYNNNNTTTEETGSISYPTMSLKMTYAVARCPSVFLLLCLCDTRRYSIEMAKHIIKLFFTVR